MMKRMLMLAVLCLTLSGCFMAPMALIGPVTSGFSTASIIQSGISSGAGYVVKRSTGKSISEHALSALTGNTLQQTYFPKSRISLIVAP